MSHVKTIVLCMGLMALGACMDSSGGLSNGASVTRLMDKQFIENGWGNGAWSSRRTAVHKCPEKHWFYTGIGAQTSVEGLIAFWDGANPEGLDMNQNGSRSFKVAEKALSGQTIPDELKQKARCFTTASLAQSK